MPLYLISRKNVKISTKYAKKTTTISWSVVPFSQRTSCFNHFKYLILIMISLTIQYQMLL